MCPPSLHVTLGIFLRLFVLLEDECHRLDLSVSLQGSNSGPSYERHATALHQQTELKTELHTLKNGLEILEQILTFTLATAANAESNPLFMNLAASVAEKKERKKNIVREIQTSTVCIFMHGYVCRPT